MRIIVTVFYLIILISCSIPKKNNEIFEILDFQNKDINLSEILDIQFIPLETTRESIIGLISTVKVVDDRVFIFDKYRMKEVFVFDIKGNFITKVGEKGGGPTQFVSLTGFDIDKKRQTIILADYKNKLLFYDLENYQYKYDKKTDFSYFDFVSLQENAFAFFFTDGFSIAERAKNNFVLITDTFMEPQKACYHADFTTPIIVRNYGENFYKLNNRSFVYHHLMPFVYEIEKNDIKPKYKLDFETFKFPSMDFLKSETKEYADYTKSLSNSDFISNYGIYETNDMVWTQFVKNRQLYTGFYNKKDKQGYILPLNNYFKSLGLGALVFPKGNTDEYLICEVQIEENTLKYAKDNLDYQKIIQKRSKDDNPVLCLIKMKSNE